MADLLQADRIETIDTLGMIALAEAVGFDDLEFTPLVRDLLLASPLRLERGAVTLAVGRGDKRIIFESAGDPDDDDGQACLREAVFIVLPEAVPGMALSSRIPRKSEGTLPSVRMSACFTGIGTAASCWTRSGRTSGAAWSGIPGRRGPRAGRACCSRPAGIGRWRSTLPGRWSAMRVSCRMERA